MVRLNKLLIIGLLLITTASFASVIPEYATNTYTKKSLSRSEKKCIDEGFSITYESCSQMTAPINPCPYHQNYYKACSQEQWCINNNYSFKLEDCQIPTYPVKKCDNNIDMYRACQLDIKKACETQGFFHKESCKITQETCPHSVDYGKCCTACEEFEHDINNIPAGYIAVGPTCVNCDDITKTNVTENPCEGFVFCNYGPASTETASCQKGPQMLYENCKTVEQHCIEEGYTKNSCASSEDSASCPEFDGLMKCTINCYKLASETFPDADIINENVIDPKLDITKDILKSTYGTLSETCKSDVRPEITLNLNDENMGMYFDVLNRKISDVSLILNYIQPIELPINGEFKNVRIKIIGDTQECALKGHKIKVSGTLNISGADNLCADISVEDGGKLITTGNIKGNIELGKDTSLAVKGNVFGSLKTAPYSEIFIKGILKYKDSANNSIDNESITFGCGSKAKIAGGIIAETSNIVLKQRALIDTAYIKIISTSDNTDLPNTLSSIHIHKGAKVYSVYDSSEYLLIENNNDVNCDDKYYQHIGSSVDTTKQEISLEPSELLTDKWLCRTITRKQSECAQ